MSKSLHIVSLPKITTSGDISPWKDVLEEIGFTVDTTAGTAIWKDSGVGFYISNSYIYAYGFNGPTNSSIFSNIVNATVNFRYIKFNEKDIAFSIASIAASEYIDCIICNANTDWLFICGSVTSSTLAPGFKAQPDGYSKSSSVGYTDMEILLVPFKSDSLKPQNLYIGVYYPNIAVKKSYICNVGNKMYYYNRVNTSNTNPGIAIDIDAIWDDSDY